MEEKKDKIDIPLDLSFRSDKSDKKIEKDEGTQETAEQALVLDHAAAETSVEKPEGIHPLESSLVRNSKSMETEKKLNAVEIVDQPKRVENVEPVVDSIPIAVPASVESFQQRLDSHLLGIDPVHRQMYSAWYKLYPYLLQSSVEEPTKVWELDHKVPVVESETTQPEPMTDPQDTLVTIKQEKATPSESSDSGRRFSARIAKQVVEGVSPDYGSSGTFYSIFDQGKASKQVKETPSTSTSRASLFREIKSTDDGTHLDTSSPNTLKRQHEQAPSVQEEDKIPAKKAHLSLDKPTEDSTPKEKSKARESKPAEQDDLASAHSDKSEDEAQASELSGFTKTPPKKKRFKQ